jgi:hypothetical protein
MQKDPDIFSNAALISHPLKIIRRCERKKEGWKNENSNLDGGMKKENGKKYMRERERERETDRQKERERERKREKEIDR